MKQDPQGRGTFWKSPLVLTGLLCAVASVSADFVLSGRTSGNLSLFVGRFHPLIVHLPIGMLVLLAVAELASLVPGLRDRVDKATTLVLPLLVASAAASFVVGHLLAGGGGFPSRLVLWHRRLTLLGILGASAALIAWAGYERLSSGGRRLLYRALVALTLVGLSAGAHYGGSITRGEAYLTKYAPEPLRRWLGPDEEPEPSASTSGPEPGREARVFDDAVLPVLRQRCVECHGPETVKASLRLDSLDAIQRGGENGPVIVAGAGDKSSLVTRMRLPMDDDERMPPEGREGPSAEEIALIAWWIDRGASESLRVRDALAPDSARSVLEKALSAAPAPSGSAPSPSATTAPSVAPTSDASAEPTAQGAATDVPPSTMAAGLVYADRVAPILSAKCDKCHGELKQKGKLRVDSLEALLQGGKEGPALVAGSADKSAILARARLPLSDPEHMPPPKEPQLTAKEIALIAFWIDRGASKRQSISELPAELRGQPPTPPAPAPTGPATTPTAEPTSPPVATATPSAPPRALPPELDLFRDVAHPILVARCSGCHGEEQDSGDLRVDLPEKLLAGGESGPAIVPGAPDKSLLLRRIHLPLDDSEHMPPEGQPQPTEAEVAALRHWIASGAKTEMPIETASLPADIAAMLAQALPAEEPPVPAPSAPVPSATASAAPEQPPGPPEPQGPPPIVSGGCAGCAASSAEGRAAPLALAALGALFLWLRRWHRTR